MRLLVKSVISEKAMNDWPLGWYGCSGIDNQDYAVSTHYLKGDEVPDVLSDAKTTSEFVAGLMNCFFRNEDATKLTVDEVLRRGQYVEEEDVAAINEDQGKIPF